MKNASNLPFSGITMKISRRQNGAFPRSNTPFSCRNAWPVTHCSVGYYSSLLWSEPLLWSAKNVGKTKGDGLLLAESILNWITILDWFSEKRGQGKSLFFFKTMKCFEQFISVRSCCNVYTSRGNDRFWLARFSCCQKKSNSWFKSCSFIFYRIYR